MTKKVLICEDEGQLRTLLVDVIHERFKDVEVCGEAVTGEEAVELFKIHRPDLIIMDLIMTKKSGLTAIREILEIAPDANIMIITAIRDEKFKMEALDMGVKKYLEKPFKLNEFIDAMEEIIQINNNN